MRLLPPSTIPGRALAISVRVASRNPADRRREGRQYADVAERLGRLLDQHHLPATWAFTSPPPSGLSCELADGGHELAASFQETSAGHAQELVGTVRRFRQAGVPVSTLLCASEPAAVDFPMLVRLGINLIAVGSTTTAAAPVATLRYGLWRVATSWEIPGREGWLRSVFAGAGIRRGVDIAVRKGQMVHVTVDAAATLESAQAVRTLERLLRHVDRRRQQGLLSVVTLSEIAQQLVRPPAAATAESILRVKAA